MATSSRPFQSQTVARLMAESRQIVRSAGQWLRQGRTAAVWGLQVALYPIYAAVQGARLGYRRLQASRPWQQAWARLTDSNSPQLVAADIPIRSLLSVIQPPVMSLTMARPSGLWLVNSYGSWLKQSRAGAVLTPGQWQLLPIQTTVQGIASDLTTRRLVLITADNSVFNGLTDDQQHRLGQAIALMLAEHARGYRQVMLTQHLQQPGLPLPQSKPSLFLPLRWIPEGLRWMQTSTLAAATNLFGEAAQHGETQAIALRKRDVSQKSRRYPSVESPLREISPDKRPDSHSAHHNSQPHSSIAWDTLPTTTSVADAVAMVLAAPGTVAAVDGPSGIVPHAVLGKAVSTDLTVKGTQEGSVHAVLNGEISPTSRANLSPKAPAASDSHQLAAPSVLEAKVTQVSYIDPPLVALLRGLDWVLYVLEAWLHKLGAWLRHHW